jgi:hypothetical protein
MCFNRVRNVTTLETCVFLAKSRPTRRSRRALGQVNSGASCRMKRTSVSVKSGPTQRSRRAFYLGRIMAFAPHQAGFSFGRIGTDAALQARVYSGRIVASRRVKRASSSVKSGLTRRSRRAFTQVESWPRAASSGLPPRSNRDRRDAPGVRLLRPNRGLAPRQADFIFGHNDK